VNPSRSQEQQHPEGTTAGEEQDEEHSFTPPHQSALGLPQEVTGPIPGSPTELTLDDKAKQAVIEGFMDEIKKGATLPLDSGSVFIGNNKQTTDLAKGLRYYMGKATAGEF